MVKAEFNKENHFVFQGEHKFIYDLVIAKSGTNTMEFIANKEPTIVYYKASKISEWILKLKVNKELKYINLINIVADKMIVPEFLQKNFTPQNILLASFEFLDNQEKTANQVNLCSQVLKKLSCPLAGQTPADMVKNYLLNL